MVNLIKWIAAVSIIVALPMDSVFAQTDVSKLEFIIKGTITDAVTKAPIEGAKVTLTGTDGSKAELATAKNGKYAFDKKDKKERYVKHGVSYRIVVTADGYKKAEGEEQTKDAEESLTFELDFALEKAD